jgi:hypothetical protein
MQFGTFQTLNGNSHARYKIIAHASDAIMQDKLIRVNPVFLLILSLVISLAHQARKLHLVTLRMLS